MNTKQQIWMETIVGLMGFLLIAALFVLTVILSSEALFSRPSPITIVFDDVMGLRVGDNVTSRGVTLGKIKAIHFAEDGVHVLAMLNDPLPLQTDYHIEVQPSSLLGGRNLVIHQGSSPTPLPPSTVLRGIAPPDLVVSTTLAVQEIRSALNDGIIDDFRASLANLRAISQNLKDGQGTLGALLMSPTMLDDLQTTFANLRSLSHALVHGQGTLGRLLSDDQLYTNAATLTANLRSLSDTLVQGQGTLGKLLSKDSTPYDNLSSTLASFQTISHTLAQGQGTIGRLLMDDQLYLDLQSLLREGRAAMDDMRETSPITTFSSILFGIF